MKASELVNTLKSLGFDAREGWNGVVHIFGTRPGPSFGCHANTCNVWFTFNDSTSEWSYHGPTADQPHDYHAKPIEDFFNDTVIMPEHLKYLTLTL